MEYYLAIKRNGILTHGNNLDEPQKLYAKWKKPVTKDPILYDSIYMKGQNRQIFENGK